MRPAGLAAFERAPMRGPASTRSSGGRAAARVGGAPAGERGGVEYFDSRPPWYRRTAIHLVTSAKREETRERRLEQLIEDSAAGRDIEAATTMTDDPVIVTCSISGAVANREQCPAIPYTPEEYAAEARRASTRARR